MPVTQAVGLPSCVCWYRKYYCCVSRAVSALTSAVFALWHSTVNGQCLNVVGIVLATTTRWRWHGVVELWFPPNGGRLDELHATSARTSIVLAFV